MSLITSKEFVILLETTQTKFYAIKLKDPEFPDPLPEKVDGRLLWKIGAAKDYAKYYFAKKAKTSVKTKITRMYKKGMSIQQISEELNIPAPNVKDIFYTIQRDYVIEKINPFNLMNQALRNK